MIAKYIEQRCKEKLFAWLDDDDEQWIIREIHRWKRFEKSHGGEWKKERKKKPAQTAGWKKKQTENRLTNKENGREEDTEQHEKKHIWSWENLKIIVTSKYHNT
jgi:hypothetical protein